MNARPIHLLVSLSNTNLMSKCYQQGYQCFDDSIPDPRDDNVLGNFYHCDLATSGLKLENVKVASKINYQRCLRSHLHHL